MTTADTTSDSLTARAPGSASPDLPPSAVTAPQRAEPSTPAGAGRSKEGPFASFLRATEVDARLLGMLGALVVIWVGFHVYPGIEARGVFGLLGGLLTAPVDTITGIWNDGRFLTPRNLWNLSVQTASIGVMATGMVLVIVTRHIDLSVGSILGLCAMAMALMQVEVLPGLVGLGSPAIWVIAAAFGLMVGAAIGAFHGVLIAYAGIPAFIVTLGGLLVWRGATFLTTRGETIAPLDDTFELLGGGPQGSIGATGSWIVGLVAIAAILVTLYLSRRQRARFSFPQRPPWAEALLAIVGCGLVVGFVLLVNSYDWPRGIVRRAVAAGTLAEGEVPAHGFAIPVLILIAVGLVMTFLVNRTRFGRYVFAIGGNPEAAALAGIRTRWVTVKIFALMGMLAGLGAVISSARLGSAASNLGTLDELYVIAAAVIGGTSFAGGIGTIYGAILGAVVMQSLQSGMVLIGFDAALQQVVVGSVLVFAVWLDTLYRGRAK